VLPDGLLPAALKTFAGFPEHDVLPGITGARGRAALGLGLEDEPGSGRFLLFDADTNEYLGVRKPRSRGPSDEWNFTETTSLDGYTVVKEARKRP